MAKSKKHQKPANLKSTKNHKKHQKRVKANLAILNSL